jgi:uncharacterized protein YkwD
MKKILLFILIFSYLHIDAQTKLEKLVFDKINVYRTDSKHKSSLQHILGHTDFKIKFDTTLYKSAVNQSTYLSKEDETYTNVHINRLDKRFRTPIERYSYYGGSSIEVSENIILLPYNENDEITSDIIVDGWRKSKEHNIIMLSDGRFGSVSIILYKKKNGRSYYVATFNILK